MANGTGSITGYVTDTATGLPVPGVQIQVVNSSGYYVGTGTSDGTGAYTVGGLSSGTYYAYTSYAPGYIPEVFSNIWCEYSCNAFVGTPIGVSDGSITSGVNFMLERYGSISGAVSDVQTGQPLGGVGIFVTRGSGYFSRYAQTDSSGNYQLSELLPGTYFVKTESTAYLDQLYQRIPCENNCDVTTGDPVVVSSGANTGGIDFSLQRAGSISGRITSQLTGSGLTGSVTIYDSNGNFVRAEWAKSDGTYQVPGLLAGTYFAVASYWDHAPVLYDGIACVNNCIPTAGTPITVVLGEDTAGINFALPRLGAIAGMVSDATTAFPIDGVFLSVFSESGEYNGSFYNDFTGAYRIGGLVAGNYFIKASHPYYIDELYDDLVCQPQCDLTAGTPVSVSFNSTTEAIDFALELGGGITGTVTAATTGNPLAYVAVQVFDASGRQVDQASTGYAGTYVVRDLFPGTYFAVARDQRIDPEYVGQLYDRLPCEPSCSVTAGTPITVTLGHATTSINFALDAFGKLAGRVVEAITGQPLAFAFVSVYDASGSYVGFTPTDSDGAYTMKLTASGSYFATAMKDGYVSQLYSGINCLTPCAVTSGTPVPVSLNTTTTDVNFALSKLGEIAGSVVDFGTNTPLSSVFVALYGSDGTYLEGRWTNSAGSFQFQGLLPGTYYAVAQGPSGFVSELYSNRDCHPSCTVTDGFPITASLNTVTSGVGFKLRMPYFSDVPLDHWARRWIEHIYVEGVTSGCATDPLRFCPTDPMSRKQIAVWLAKARSGGSVPVSGTVPGMGDYNCIPGGTSVFGDVAPSDSFCKFIHYLAAEGITRGCAPGLFCPNAITNRRQMAVLTAKAVASGPIPDSGTVPGMGDYNCVAGGTSVFLDVSPTDFGCKYIHFLAAQGVTSGCGGGNFCPDSLLNRAQGATFTAKGFGFHRYRPK